MGSKALGPCTLPRSFIQGKPDLDPVPQLEWALASGILFVVSGNPSSGSIAQEVPGLPSSSSLGM